jgi:hypothetical protein
MKDSKKQTGFWFDVALPVALLVLGFIAVVFIFPPEEEDNGVWIGSTYIPAWDLIPESKEPEATEDFSDFHGRVVGVEMPVDLGYVGAYERQRRAELDSVNERWQASFKHPYEAISAPRKSVGGSDGSISGSTNHATTGR